MPVGQNTQGTLLLDSAYRQTLEKNPTATDAEAFARHKLMIDEANVVSKQLTDTMNQRRMTIGEVMSISKGYTPVVSPKGGYTDYRITMTYADKIDILNMETDAFSIMAKMYASNHIKRHAAERNELVTAFLKKDMTENMLPLAKITKEGMNYVRLTKNSSNEFVRSVWKAIPRELQEAIKKYDKEGEGFYVRDAWLQNLFGVPSMSLVDNKYVAKYTNAWVKKSILLSEHILKHITYFAKSNIVIRMPVVLISNVMSNLWYTIAMGHNPHKVFARTWRNATNIKEYILDRKERDGYVFKQRLGTATRADITKIDVLNTKLLHNPVHELMEKGMYQSIVEDITPNEVNAVGKVNKNISLKTKNWSPKLKMAFKQLYMLEGTPYHDFMFQATQYSDFIARSTYYQLEKEKAAKEGKLINKDSAKKFEETLTHDTWNAFVNYDKPQGPALQYLNDMGLLMFTKWATRIIHVIFKGSIQRPLSTFMYLLAQANIDNIAYPFDSDIFAYLPWDKNYANLIFSPWGNAINALTPMPAQWLLDMQSFPY